MQRLIDADALINKRRIISYTYPNGLMSEPGVLLKDIEKAPTIDAVPVVRCKDCKYYEPDLYANPWGVCCNRGWFVNDTGHDVDENGYCYRAERKEE